MILDTDFLISLRDSHEDALQFAAKLEASGQPTRVPTVVVQELFVGVGAGVKSDSSAGAYDALLENEPLVTVDEHVARLAGKLEGRHLRSDDKPDLGPVDAIVAATGISISEPVVSRDEDFGTVDGLDVATW